MMGITTSKAKSLTLASGSGVNAIHQVSLSENNIPGVATPQSTRPSKFRRSFSLNKSFRRHRKSYGLQRKHDGGSSEQDELSNKCGYLYKYSDKESWQRLWCVLRGSNLNMYQSPDDDHTIGFYRIRQTMNIDKLGDGYMGKNFVIKLQQEQTCQQFIAMETEEEMSDWLKQFNVATKADAAMTVNKWRAMRGERIEHPGSATCIKEDVSYSEQLVKKGKHSANEQLKKQHKLSLLEEQQSSTEVVGEQQSSTEVIEQQSSTEVIGEQQSSTEVIGEQQSSTEVIGEQQSSTEVIGEQQSSTKVIEQQSSTEVIGEQQSSTEVKGEQQSCTEVIGEQQSSTEVIGEQQSSTEVIEQQSSTKVIGEKQKITEQVQKEGQNVNPNDSSREDVTQLGKQEKTARRREEQEHVMETMSSHEKAELLEIQENDGKQLEKQQVERDLPGKPQDTIEESRRRQEFEKQQYGMEQVDSKQENKAAVTEQQMTQSSDVRQTGGQQLYSKQPAELHDNLNRSSCLRQTEKQNKSRAEQKQDVNAKELKRSSAPEQCHSKVFLNTESSKDWKHLVVLKQRKISTELQIESLQRVLTSSHSKPRHKFKTKISLELLKARSDEHANGSEGSAEVRHWKQQLGKLRQEYSDIVSEIEQCERKHCWYIGKQTDIKPDSPSPAASQKTMKEVIGEHRRSVRSDVGLIANHCSDTPDVSKWPLDAEMTNNDKNLRQPHRLTSNKPTRLQKMGKRFPSLPLLMTRKSLLKRVSTVESEDPASGGGGSPSSATSNHQNAARKSLHDEQLSSAYEVPFGACKEDAVSDNVATSPTGSHTLARGSTSSQPSSGTPSYSPSSDSILSSVMMALNKFSTLPKAELLSLESSFSDASVNHSLPITMDGTPTYASQTPSDGGVSPSSDINTSVFTEASLDTDSGRGSPVMTETTVTRATSSDSAARRDEENTQTNSKPIIRSETLANIAAFEEFIQEKLGTLPES